MSEAIVSSAGPDRSGADWWRQACVYQIYPRSFGDSNADGIGDLPGITSRVPYLAALGIDAVWLSPFYPSALYDGGYDVDDHRDVDPRLGTLDDFDQLCAALHHEGIKLIVDIVPNHSSSRHPWFVEALAAEPGSVARQRYIFRDGRGPDGDEPPSDWPSHFGGSAWTRVPDGQWYLHLFDEHQPDFDWSNAEVRADFLTTLRFWADRGVDGFRVDVAHALAKDLAEPLRSAPLILELGIPTDGSNPLFDRDEVHTIYAEWREVFNEYDPPRAAVAEAVVPMARRVLYARPSELGQAFNFDLVRADFDATQYRRIVTESLAEAAASGASSTWVLSNHDIVRHVSRYALPPGTPMIPWLLSDGHDPAPDLPFGLRSARAATLLMLALPGSAYLYQGEELGLPEVADLPIEALADPIWERTGHAEKGRDGSRVPLPWTAEPPPPAGSFGFGDAGAHLPQPDWFGPLAADAQDGDQDSTLTLYRRALSLRRDLQGAETLDWLGDSDSEVLHFRRPGAWESVTNFSAHPVPMPSGTLLLSSAAIPTPTELPPHTTAWLRSPHPLDPW